VIANESKVSDEDEPVWDAHLGEVASEMCTQASNWRARLAPMK
jgi:hypothetical protein